MNEQREQLLEALNPLLADLISKAKSGRVRDPQTWKLRLSTVNSLSNLLRTYNQILRDSEIEEILSEIEEVKNAINEQNQEGY